MAWQSNYYCRGCKKRLSYNQMIYFGYGSCCPYCGSTTRAEVRSERWVSTIKICRPLTWFGVTGYWTTEREVKDGFYEA